MKVLLVEDDKNLLSGLMRELRSGNWELESARNAATALQKIEDTDVLVTDVRMPGMNGIELMSEARERCPGVEVIVMTAYGTIPAAIEAMRNGARAYLTKPFDTEELLLHLGAVQRLLLLREAAAKAGRGDLVGSSAVMRGVYKEIDVAAASAAPILVTGETGTGKDLAANAIHALSSRKGGPFITVNLGAFPRDLVDGELFGHEKGAFTGAHARKQGRFVVADGGTLFLDEIDSLPLDLQPKLLRAIEKKEVWPLGAEKSVNVDVRIVAATNANLENLIGEGMFRKDLYYRLNVLRIEMPPLAQHAEDIPQIARVLLDRLAEQHGCADVEITPATLSYLITQPWKGNVRELSNILERGLARIMAARPEDAPEGEHIILDIDAFDEQASATAPPQGDLPFKEAKIRAADEWAKQAIRATLAETQGNVSEAARRLQMSRTALIRLINKYGIDKD